MYNSIYKTEIIKDIIHKYYRYIIIFIIAFTIGFCANNCQHVEPQQPKIEYVQVRDTITVDKVQIQEKTTVEYVNKIDTFYVNNTDTIYLYDLPIEYKTYNDTIKTDSSNTIIDLNYHGFNAGIDNLSIQNEYFNKNTIIQKQPKRFGIDFVIGPQVGYGYGFKGASPYVGIGATIGFSYRLTK